AACAVVWAPVAVAEACLACRRQSGATELEGARGPKARVSPAEAPASREHRDCPARAGLQPASYPGDLSRSASPVASPMEDFPADSCWWWPAENRDAEVGNHRRA